jgi:hypothetical protein
MPFRSYHQFDTEAVRLMTEAYDAALLQLGITGKDPMSGELAAQIAMLANNGERDPVVLCAKGLERLKLGNVATKAAGAEPTQQGP